MRMCWDILKRKCTTYVQSDSTTKALQRLGCSSSRLTLLLFSWKEGIPMTDEEQFYLKTMYSGMAHELRKLWERHNDPATKPYKRKHIKARINRQVTNMRQLRDKIEGREVG